MTDKQRWGSDYLTIEAYNDSGMIKAQPCPVAPGLMACCVEGLPDWDCVSYVSHRNEGDTTLVDCREVEMISGRCHRPDPAPDPLVPTDCPF